MKLALFVAIAAFGLAQDAAPVTVPAPLELNAAEKQFQEALNNVTLIGYFTQGDGKELTDDKYVIERVTKVKEDTWKFEARIQYNKKDFKVAMNLPVKFAGDTPVISLTISACRDSDRSPRASSFTTGPMRGPGRARLPTHLHKPAAAAH